MILCACAALASAGTAHAQGIFLETTPGILGEATAPGYEDQIALASAQFGMATPCGVTSNLSISEFTATKAADRATVDLAAAVQAGTVYTEFVVRFAKDDPLAGVINKQTMTFKDVVVTSYSMSSGGDDVFESFSFVFSEVTIEYRYVDSKGGQSPETVTILGGPACP
jgi:type VI protein secretion system component Hcp